MMMKKKKRMRTNKKFTMIPNKIKFIIKVRKPHYLWVKLMSALPKNLSSMKSMESLMVKRPLLLKKVKARKSILTPISE